MQSEQEQSATLALAVQEPRLLALLAASHVQLRHALPRPRSLPPATAATDAVESASSPLHPPAGTAEVSLSHSRYRWLQSAPPMQPSCVPSPPSLSPSFQPPLMPAMQPPASPPSTPPPPPTRAPALKSWYRSGDIGDSEHLQSCTTICNAICTRWYRVWYSWWYHDAIVKGECETAPCSFHFESDPTLSPDFELVSPLRSPLRLKASARATPGSQGLKASAQKLRSAAISKVAVPPLNLMTPRSGARASQLYYLTTAEREDAEESVADSASPVPSSSREFFADEPLVAPKALTQKSTPGMASKVRVPALDLLIPQPPLLKEPPYAAQCLSSQPWPQTTHGAVVLDGAIADAVHGIGEVLSVSPCQPKLSPRGRHVWV